MITLHTAAGTVAQGWEGYPAETGLALAGEWVRVWEELTGERARVRWQWTGYPAATFPMRPSVLAGWEEMVRLINSIPGKFVLDGYSQGALVVCMLWRHDLLAPSGRLHHRLNDCLAVITYGNPMRAPGVAYGNTLLWGRPAPGPDDGYTTGGIAGPGNLHPSECLFPDSHPQTGKPAVYDFANPGDLYAAAPCGDDPWNNPTKVGSNETLIYESVMDFNGGDLFSWAKTIFKTISMPWTTVWPMFQSIWNGIQFLKAGMNAPHWQYDSRPATDFVRRLSETE